MDRIQEAGFKGTLFGVHYAVITIPKLDKELKHFYGYLTPLNPLGVMMFPTKVSAEEAVNKTKKDVYAIKPFAGGRIEPILAFTYVFNFHVKGCLFGAGFVSEVKSDLESAIKAKSDKRERLAKNLQSFPNLEVKM